MRPVLGFGRLLVAVTLVAGVVAAVPAVAGAVAPVCVYVANAGSDSVSVIDGSSQVLARTIPVGAVPTGVWASSSGRVVVAANGADSVAVIDGATNAVTTTIAVGQGPWSVASSAGAVYVTDNGSDTVSVIDGSSLSVVATVPVGSSPQAVAVSSAGDVYVADAGSDSVSVIDPSTNTVVRTIAVGAAPIAVAVGTGNCSVPTPPAPVGSGPASPPAAVRGTVTMSPSSGTTASTDFALSLTGSGRCDGDADAGHRWQTFLIDAAVDLQTVQFDGTGPVPSMPADAGRFAAALFDTSSVPVLGRMPMAGTGAIASIPRLSFAGDGTVPDGTYNLGVACTHGDAGTGQLTSLWVTVVTFSGADWTQVTEFMPVVPTRVFDTRPGSAGLRSVPQARVGPDAPLCVAIAGVGGVPSSAAAVALNVAATENDDPGFLTVYPGGATRPGTASVNYVAHDIASNMVLTGLNDLGVACVFSMVPAHVVVDVTGWFPPGSSFTAPTPARVLDTRPDQTQGLRPVAKRKVGPTAALEVNFTDLGATVPASGVGAVALNVTVTESDGPGFITVYPCGSRPLASSLNFTTGQTIPNAVVTRLSTDGTACFHSSTDAHVIVDVVGWFAGSGNYTPVVPTRMADTRSGEVPGLRPVRPGKLVPSEDPLTIGVTSVGPLPSHVRAVVLNLAVTATEGPGFVTAWPCGARPSTSSLNFTTADVTRSNAVIIPVSAAGEICFWSMTPTHVVIDVVGYFG